MTHNENKYWVEDSDQLSESEKTRMAQALLELESRGVLEYRDGQWRLAPGVGIEQTADGLVPRFLKEKDAESSQVAKSSTTSSGEPSETRVPPLEQAAQPLSQGSGSPDSDDEVNKQ